MKILTCNGNDQYLYHWIGNLVIDKSVLKYNNNYPYRTSENHVWHIAYDDTQVLGFIPVERRKKKWVINNYYIANDNPEVFSSLIQHVLEAGDSLPIESVTQIQHVDNFKAFKFEIQLYWKKYVKMIYVSK